MRLIRSTFKTISINLIGVSFLAVLFMVIGLPAKSEGVSEDKAKLIDGAKKEGKIVLYTTMSVPHADGMLKAFQKKYPFIKAEFYRASSLNLMNKILIEMKNNRYVPDVIDMPGFQTAILAKKGVYDRYISAERPAYQEGYKDADGYWTSIYLNPYLIGYNTKLLSRKDIPDTYEGFLDPKWKGKKIGFDSKEVEWFANMLKIMGEEKGLEFMKKFAAQDLQYRRGHTLIGELIMAGEFPVGTIYPQIVEDKRKDGAPIEWVGVSPVIVKLGTSGISARAPHPNAAKLYIDFCLSKEGQMLIGSFGRLPARPDVELPLRKALEGTKLYPSDLSLVENYGKYFKEFKNIFNF